MYIALFIIVLVLCGTGMFAAALVMREIFSYSPMSIGEWFIHVGFCAVSLILYLVIFAASVASVAYLWPLAFIS